MLRETECQTHTQRAEPQPARAIAAVIGDLPASSGGLGSSHNSACAEPHKAESVRDTQTAPFLTIEQNLAHSRCSAWTSHCPDSGSLRLRSRDFLPTMLCSPLQSTWMVAPAALSSRSPPASSTDPCVRNWGQLRALGILASWMGQEPQGALSRREMWSDSASPPRGALEGMEVGPGGGESYYASW